jgi:hypothetical protein
MEAAKKNYPGPQMEGVITLPEGSRVVHVGAAPPKGELLAFAEIPDLDMPPMKIEIRIVRCEDPVPDGYEYMGHILAVPILFIYKRKPKSLIL